VITLWTGSIECGCKSNHLLNSVEVVGGDRWGTFQGSYFRRIEVPDLLQRQRSVSHPQNDASSAGVSDAAACLMFFASGSSIGGSHTGNELE
jgi:hypothetical protein